MIYPQDDEQFMGQPIYGFTYPFSVSDLKIKSPTLPLHFDKKYLPKDLCQKQLIGASECLLLYNVNEKDKENMCSLEVSKFQSCRRKRDLKIISAIYQWENLHVRNLDSQNRAFYIRGLGFKLDRLEDDLKRQPSTITGLNRISELQKQIKELKWRLSYLGKLKEELS